ncbi:low-density lipoprotein receptor class A domain-containing protein 2 isoform X1 [Lampetra fluviatilis]
MDTRSLALLMMMTTKTGLLLLMIIAPGRAIDSAHLVEVCGRSLTAEGLVLSSHRESRRFYFVGADTDCWLSVRAAGPDQRLIFQFRFFLVYSLLRVTPAPGASLSPPPPNAPALDAPHAPGASEDPCHAGSYLQFYDGVGRGAPSLGPPLCGKSIPEAVVSHGRALTLRLVTRGKLPRVDFVGDFSAFTLESNGSSGATCGPDPCTSRYFRCRNARCVPWSLVCDARGLDNCGDESDETHILPPACAGWLPTAGPDGAAPNASLRAPGPFPTPACGVLFRPSREPREPPGNLATQPGSVAVAVPGAALTPDGGPARPPLPPGGGPEPPRPARGSVVGPGVAAALLSALLLGLALWCCCCACPGWCAWRLGACAPLVPACCARKAAGRRVNPGGGGDGGADDDTRPALP